MSFHFTKRSENANARGGYQVRCCFHNAEVSARSDSVLPCTREMAFPDGDDGELCIRCLKHWCLQCVLAGSRREHMDHRIFPRGVPDALPSAEELDASLLRLTSAQAV